MFSHAQSCGKFTIIFFGPLDPSARRARVHIWDIETLGQGREPILPFMCLDLYLLVHTDNKLWNQNQIKATDGNDDTDDDNEDADNEDNAVKAKGAKQQQRGGTCVANLKLDTLQIRQGGRWEVAKL